MNLDLSVVADQPRYVLYGSGLILLGVVLLVVGLLLL